MKKNLVEITKKFGRQLDDLCEKDDSVSYLIVVAKNSETNEGQVVKSTGIMGGSIGGVASGLMSLLVGNPQGENVIKAYKHLLDREKCDVEIKVDNTVEE